MNRSQFLIILVSAGTLGVSMAISPYLGGFVGLLLSGLLTWEWWFKVDHYVTWSYDLKFLGKIVLTALLGTGFHQGMCVLLNGIGVTTLTCDLPFGRIFISELLLLSIGVVGLWGFARIAIWRAFRHRK